MADTIKKYLDLVGLGKYDAKLKTWANSTFAKPADITVTDVQVKHRGSESYVTTLDGTTAKLDLTSYALKSDLVAVLKFVGVVDYVKDLPTATADTVGHIYHVKYEGDSGTTTLNAEYVGVDMGESASPRYKWEEMGSYIDLSKYYTKTEVDGLITAEATARNGAITAAIEALDADKSQTAAAGNGYLALSITEVDGKITSISGSVDSTKYDEAGAASTAESNAKSYADGLVNALDLTAVSETGKFISSVSQENGQVAASLTAFDTSISDSSTIAPQSKAVKSYVDTKVSAEATRAAAAEDAIMTRSGSEGSYTYSGYAKDYADAKVASEIDALDATVRGSLTDADALASGKHVGVKVVEENGKLTSVLVVEGDIASAATLATVNGADTVDGSFRKYTKDAIAALDVTAATGDYLVKIGETDGKIDNIEWGTAVSTEDGITSSATGLVQAKAVYAAVEAAKTAAATDATSKANAAKVYVAESDALTSTQINGLQAITESEINSLFA